MNGCIPNIYKSNLFPSCIVVKNLQLIKLVEWLEKASIKREDSKIILQVNNSEDLELYRKWRSSPNRVGKINADYAASACLTWVNGMLNAEKI